MCIASYDDTVGLLKGQSQRYSRVLKFLKCNFDMTYFPLLKTQNTIKVVYETCALHRKSSEALCDHTDHFYSHS